MTEKELLDLYNEFPNKFIDYLFEGKKGIVMTPMSIIPDISPLNDGEIEFLKNLDVDNEGHCHLYYQCPECKVESDVANWEGSLEEVITSAYSFFKEKGILD